MRQPGYRIMSAGPAQQEARSFAAQLLVQMDGCEERLINVRPGCSTIGRAPDSDIVLDHPAISQTHCTVEAGRDGVVVRDLGSTNGTFVDGQPVREAVLMPGQRLRLGTVELTLRDVALESPAGAPLPESRPEPSPRPNPGPARCANHPQARAAWLCTECQRQFCTACVKPVKLDTNRTAVLCQSCDGLCESLEKVERRSDKKAFARGLIRALAYPLQPALLLLLAGAAVLNFVLSVSGRWFLFSGFSLVLGMGLGAFIVTYLRQVLVSATEGEEAIPAWPEMDMEHLKDSILLFTATYIVCFGPWTLCTVFVRPETEGAQLACHALLGLGVFYFPMALLAVVTHDDAAALNPVLVGISIMRSGLRYLGLCLFVIAIAGAVVGIESALNSAGSPRLAAGASGLFSGYAALVITRAIGWFGFCSRERMGWA